MFSIAYVKSLKKQTKRNKKKARYPSPESTFVMDEEGKSPASTAVTPTENDTPPSSETPSSEPVTESGTSTEIASTSWVEVKCVFCNQELKDSNEPKLLQCLHTACKACLETESAPSPSSSTSNSAGRKRQVQRYVKTPTGQSVKQLACPGCNQDINPLDSIDHLFALELLSQSGEGFQEDSKSYSCTSCEEGADATGFCQDCQEWLCETCVSAHHRVRVTKDHVIRPKEEMDGEKTTGLSQKYLFCPVHVHEQLKLYCDTCDKLTCRDCQLSEHKEHKYQFLSKACEEEKSYLNTLLLKIKEKQIHIENACNLVNQRQSEITEREQIVTQEVRAFAVKFITEFNKRGKILLQELSDICKNKRNQLSYKNQELMNMGQRLQHCLKFAEAAINRGSDVALVYSKKVITSQLRRILRHRCEVPNPQHMVDITFSYEPTFLMQYISTFGTLLVDQHPVSGPLAVQIQNQSRLPTPQIPPSQNHSQAVSSVHQPHISQQQMNMNQRRMPVPMQVVNQQASQMVQKSPQQYGQPQVTSSTDPAQNPTPAQLRHMLNQNNQKTYIRNQNQRNISANASQNQNANYNVTYGQRPVAQQQQQQQQQSPSQQQQPTSSRQQVPQSTSSFPSVSLPMPLMHNSNITISPVSGPTPPKQRALNPGSNVQMTPVNPQSTSGQRLSSGSSQQSQQRGPPQLIVIDGDMPNQQKMPTMSNTSRLSHFPSAAVAAISANPNLQIQPANYRNNSGKF